MNARLDEQLENSRRPQGREQVAVALAVQRRFPESIEKQAPVRTETRRGGLDEAEGVAEAVVGEIGAYGVVRGKARHQCFGDRASERLGEPPRLTELDLEKAAPVERLGNGLDSPSEACRHAAGEHNRRDRPGTKRFRSRLPMRPRSLSRRDAASG